MNNEQIAIEFNKLVKGFYNNANCRYENEKFIFSTTSKKTLQNLLFDFTRAFGMSGKKINFVNARMENKRYTIDAVCA